MSPCPKFNASAKRLPALLKRTKSILPPLKPMFPQVAVLELLRFCTLIVFKWLSRENRRYEGLLISKVNALDLPQKVDSMPLFYRLPNTLDSRKKTSRSSVIVTKTLTLLFNKDKSMLSSARERSAMPKSRLSFGIRVDVQTQGEILRREILRCEVLSCEMK